MSFRQNAVIQKEVATELQTNLFNPIQQGKPHKLLKIVCIASVDCNDAHGTIIDLDTAHLPDVATVTINHERNVRDALATDFQVKTFMQNPRDRVLYANIYIKDPIEIYRLYKKIRFGEITAVSATWLYRKGNDTFYVLPSIKTNRILNEIALLDGKQPSNPHSRILYTEWVSERLDKSSKGLMELRSAIDALTTPAISAIRKCTNAATGKPITTIFMNV